MKTSTFAGIMSGYLALAYVIGIVYFGVLTPYATLQTSTEFFTFIQTHSQSLYWVMTAIYIIFAIALLGVVQAFSQTKRTTKYPAVLAWCQELGRAWAVLLLASGFVYTVGMTTAQSVAPSDSAQAIMLVDVTRMISDALGGGSELIGGLWVLAMSSYALWNSWAMRALHIGGMIVGISGVLSHIPGLEIFQMVFGLTQIIWFIGLSVFFFSKKS